MLTSEPRPESIARVASFPQRLIAVVEPLSDEQLDTPYAEGKWTVRQVVHHLADAHMHAFLRMKNVMTDDPPKLTEYDQVRYADLPDASHPPIGMSLMLLLGLHSRWVVFLNSLTDDDWSRSGVHFRRGRMTLDDMLRHYADHGDSHLKQITDLCSARGWHIK